MIPVYITDALYALAAFALLCAAIWLGAFAAGGVYVAYSLAQLDGIEIVREMER